MHLASNRWLSVSRALWAAPVLPLLLLPRSVGAQVAYGIGHSDPYKSGPTRPFDGSPRSGVYSVVPSPRYEHPPSNEIPPQRVGLGSGGGEAPAIWRGLYAGALLGHRWSTARNDVLGIGSLQARGWNFGGAIGHNFQTGNLVYGLEGDFLVGNSANALSGSGSSLSYRDTWSASLRGRAGYTTASTLFYLTGGVAFAGQELSVKTSTFSGSLGASQPGWVVGAGIETKLTSHLSARLEGLHTSYRDATLGAGTSGQTLKLDNNVLRAGLIYSFN